MQLRTDRSASEDDALDGPRVRDIYPRVDYCDPFLFLRQGGLVTDAQ